jgi:hypothetical protein
MALNIPTYANPFDPANPLTNVYGWTAFLALDAFADQGRLQLSINPNEAAWKAQPLATLSVSLGQVFTPANTNATPPVAAVAFPTLDELMADAEFAAAYEVIGQKLYAALVANHPALTDATVV